MGIIRHPTIKHWCECRHSYTSLRNYHLEISTSINLWDATLPGCLSTTHDYDDDDDYSHSQPHTRTTQTRTHFSRHSFIHSFDRMIRSSINHGNHGSFEPCTILDICVYISISSRLDGIMMNTLSLKCSNYRSYGTVRITNINTTTSTIRPTSSHESRFQAILPSTVTYQSIFLSIFLSIVRSVYLTYIFGLGSQGTEQESSLCSIVGDLPQWLGGRVHSRR